MCRTEEASATAPLHATAAIRRADASGRGATIRRSNFHEHPKLTSGGLRTPAGGSNKQMQSRRRGEAQNPSGERLHAHAGNDQRSGHSVRGRRHSAPRHIRDRAHAGFVVDQTQSDSCTAVPKRKRRRKKPILVSEFNDDHLTVSYTTQTLPKTLRCMYTHLTDTLHYI